MFCRAMVKLSFINKKQKVKVNKSKKKSFVKVHTICLANCLRLKFIMFSMKK